MPVLPPNDVPVPETEREEYENANDIAMMEDEIADDLPPLVPHVVPNVDTSINPNAIVEAIDEPYPSFAFLHEFEGDYPFEDALLVNDFLNRILPIPSTGSIVSATITSEIAPPSSFDEFDSFGEEATNEIANNARISLTILRALAGVNRDLRESRERERQSKWSDMNLDSFTGAPIHENNANKLVLENGDTYDAITLIDFILMKKETRNPSSGIQFSEKDMDKILKSGACASYSSRVTEVFKQSEQTKPLINTKSEYFEEFILTMLYHCISICELDAVKTVTLSINDFNKKYLPSLIRCFSGLALTNPVRMLKLCKKVKDYIKAIFEDIPDDSESDIDGFYQYNPVVINSVTASIVELCSLSSTQFYACLSPAKLSAKICETPMARITQRRTF